MPTTTKLLSVKDSMSFLKSVGEDYSEWKLRRLARAEKLTHYRTRGSGQGKKIEFDKKDLLSYVKQNPSCQVVRAKA